MVLDVNELDELEQVQREEDLHEFCFSCAMAWHGMVCLSMALRELTYSPQEEGASKEGLVIEAKYHCDAMS